MQPEKNSLSPASSSPESAAACVCGWPETECLRRVLGNGPPFPPKPCEPKTRAPSASSRFRAVHDGDIASGVQDGHGGPVIFWLATKLNAAEWAERVAAALNASEEA